MSMNPARAATIMTHVRLARLEVEALRATGSELEDLERTRAGHDSERALAHHLARLGAMLYDAVADSEERLQSLVAGLRASNTDHIGPAPTGDVATAAAPIPPETAPRPVEPEPRTQTQPLLRRVRKSAQPTAPVVTITSDVRAQLQAALQGNRADADAQPRAAMKLLNAAQRNTMNETATMVSADPSHLRGKGPLNAELQRLEALADRIAEISSTLAQPAHHALLRYIAAAARRVQQTAPETLKGNKAKDFSARLDKLFGRLTDHSKRTQPGPTNGLARGHKPTGDSWHEDALDARGLIAGLLPDFPWIPRALAAGEAMEESDSALDAAEAFRSLRKRVSEDLETPQLISEIWLLINTFNISPCDSRLVGIASRHLEYFPDADLASGGLPRLAKAVRKLQKRDDAREPAEPWLHVARTRGRRVVIVGGDRRPEREDAIRHDLAVSALEWIPTDQGERQVDALIRRIHAGSVDLVVVLQKFISHSISDKLFAARSDSCDVVLAESYGVKSIRRGLERFFGLDTGDSSSAINTQ